MYTVLTEAYGPNNCFWAVGYCMKKWKLPSAALILSFVLGKNIEFTLVQTLASSENGLLLLFQRPISATLLTLCEIILAVGIYTTLKNKRDKLAADALMGKNVDIMIVNASEIYAQYEAKTVRIIGLVRQRELTCIRMLPHTKSLALIMFNWPCEVWLHPKAWTPAK